MIIQEVIDYLEEFAPLAYAETFDNVGLLVGEKSSNKTHWYISNSRYFRSCGR